MKMESKDRDSQVVEIAGRNWLVSQLYLAGVEVARPERDHGIDLIAFLDRGRFIACPIQVKASSQKSFDVQRRFETFPNVLMVYVWNLADAPVAYCLRYAQAEKVAKQMGWTATNSWQTGANSGRPGYGTREPSPKLIEFLEPYRVTALAQWKEAVVAAARLPNALTALAEDRPAR
jgi:hypothetical protein